jgi:hypothetical protein
LPSAPMRRKQAKAQFEPIVRLIWAMFTQCETA